MSDLSHLDSFYLSGPATPMSAAERDERRAWREDYAARVSASAERVADRRDPVEILRMIVATRVPYPAACRCDPEAGVRCVDHIDAENGRWAVAEFAGLAGEGTGHELRCGVCEGIDDPGLIHNTASPYCSEHVEPEAALRRALVAMVYVHPCGCAEGSPDCARCRAVETLGFDPCDNGTMGA